MRLREMKKEDLPLFAGWLKKPHVVKWYHDPEDWIHEVEEMDGEFEWIKHLIVEEEGKPIGFCQYYDCTYSDEVWEGYENHRGRYSIDYMIGESEYIGKGLGKQIVRKLLHIIAKAAKYESLQADVVVQPEADNHASRGVLTSCGFTCNEAGVFYIQL